ncbi:hypothetical protein SeLEV6574_g06206 [Synchytrium endobioticum]|uniref:Uncharacterized protein n=1 Tax=Synchytrium endobioticum TaxID=286115 RepID=A0A507CQ02_9FUNG|nr:hypothetical protein SeLEV6574_g06206 [Synchytrium endobioticum]
MSSTYALPPPNPALSHRKRKRKAAAAASSHSANDRLRVDDGDKDEEELALEEFIFGGDVPGTIDGVLSKAGKELDAKAPQTKQDAASPTTDIVTHDDDSDEPLFTIDTQGDATIFLGQEGKIHDHITSSLNSPKPPPAIILQPKAPVWEDDDDLLVDIATKTRSRKLRKAEAEVVISSTDYETRLRSQFEKIHPRPKWAVTDKKDGVREGDPEEMDFLKTTTTIAQKKDGFHFSPDAIAVTRLKDGNQMAYSPCVIQSVQFHPKTPVMLTAGYDKAVRLFRIDGKINPKIQSILFKDMPIHQAQFTADGKQIIATGARKHFYTYDMEKGTAQTIYGIRGRPEKNIAEFRLSPCNRYIAFVGEGGYIILASRDTKQWIANLRMNGKVRSLCFSLDGEYLYAVTSDDDIYQFETRSRQCLYKVKDISAYKTTSIALSPDNHYIATGLKSGIVNIYDRNVVFGESTSNCSGPAASITPLKSLSNLTTSIRNMAFHPTSQALLFSSRSMKDALRLAHMPSFKVFPNWPTNITPLSHVNSVDFSPNGGHLAMGNDKGRVLL